MPRLSFFTWEGAMRQVKFLRLIGLPANSHKEWWGYRVSIRGVEDCYLWWEKMLCSHDWVGDKIIMGRKVCVCSKCYHIKTLSPS